MTRGTHGRTIIITVAGRQGDHRPDPENLRSQRQLLAAGDRLVTPLGLTSARWQVLGAIDAGEEQLSVAELARRMRLSRQAVQRIANELVREDVLTFVDNPRHKNSPMVRFTNNGREIYRKALALQTPWADDLAGGLKPERIAAAIETIEIVLGRLAD